MYFYNLEGTIIIKYKVDLNITRLKKIKQDIIDNCSEINNKSYETTNPPLFNHKYIKNYKKEKTNKKDFETKSDIYLVSYDFYNPPYLVTLIDELLLGNTIVINEIKKYKENFCIDNSNIQEQYKELLSKIYDKEDIKIYGAIQDESEKERRKVLLKDMESLLTKYQNQKKPLIDEYRLQVLECINLKVLKSIPLDNLLEVQNFFSDSTEQTLNKNLYKILEKKLIKE